MGCNISSETENANKITDKKSSSKTLSQYPTLSQCQADDKKTRDYGDIDTDHIKINQEDNENAAIFYNSEDVINHNIIKKVCPGEQCKENKEGFHMYKNNICRCGKVIDIIHEDEEENDEEGQICLLSNTGNHHYVNGECKYCNILQSRRYSIVKQITKITSNKTMSKIEIQDLITLGNDKLSKFRSGSLNLIHIKDKMEKDFENNGIYGFDIIQTTGRLEGDDNEGNDEKESNRESRFRINTNGSEGQKSARVKTLILIDDFENEQ